MINVCNNCRNGFYFFECINDECPARGANIDDVGYTREPEEGEADETV